jgi:hypothetical protein
MTIILGGAAKKGTADTATTATTAMITAMAPQMPFGDDNQNDKVKDTATPRRNGNSSRSREAEGSGNATVLGC